jgi:hypothetical protein
MCKCGKNRIISGDPFCKECMQKIELQKEENKSYLYGEGLYPWLDEEIE